MIKTNKMDIATAIEFTENAVLAGKLGFFVNTEFGKIAFEVEAGVINDPTMSVLACSWQDAPQTKWAVENSDKNCEWYCSIARVKSKFSIHMYVTEALIRCILMKCIGTDVDDTVVDAAVASYLSMYENRQLTVNYIEKEFVRVHYNLITSKDPMVQLVTRDWIIRRINDCNRVLSQTRKLMRQNQDKRIDFIDDFAEMIWGLTMYSVGAGIYDVDTVAKAICMNDEEV